MSDLDNDPSPYRVVYSEDVREALRTLGARAKAQSS
jgi:hypothetical protein